MLADLLSTFGVRGARYIEEYLDPQFSAIKRVIEFVPIKYVVANSLVSYQLSGKGENYWWEFSDYFSKGNSDNVVDDFSEFLSNSRFNRRLTSIKINRLKKIEPLLNSIGPEWSLSKVWNELGSVFGSNRKTVVFAVKMFGYAQRVLLGKFEPYPFGIPIPLDSRIQKITQLYSPSDPLQFWFDVSENSKIPPLHIDSILWNLSLDTSSKEQFERDLSFKLENIINSSQVNF